MKKNCKNFAFAVCAIALSACEPTNTQNSISDADDPLYQQVSTVENAEAFYSDKTIFIQPVEFVGLDGKVAQPGRVPSEFTVRPKSYTAEYFAPGGKAYLVFSGRTDVLVGSWQIKQSGQSYARICSTFPALTTGEKCKPPRNHLEQKNRYANLYSGDILNLKSGRFPAGARNVDVTAPSVALIASLGFGRPQVIKAKQKK